MYITQSIPEQKIATAPIISPIIIGSVSVDASETFSIAPAASTGEDEIDGKGSSVLGTFVDTIGIFIFGVGGYTTVIDANDTWETSVSTFMTSAPRFEAVSRSAAENSPPAIESDKVVDICCDNVVGFSKNVAKSPYRGIEISVSTERVYDTAALAILLGTACLFGNRA